MMRPLDLELSTYERQRVRLEDQHPGKFVLIRGEKIAGIFEDFQSASEYAADRLQRQAYLIHGIGEERMRIPSGLLAGLAAMCADARRSGPQRSISPPIAHRHRPTVAGHDGGEQVRLALTLGWNAGEEEVTADDIRGPNFATARVTPTCRRSSRRRPAGAPADPTEIQLPSGGRR